MLDIQIEEENEEKSLIALNVQGELDSTSFLDFYDYIINKLNKGYSLFILDFSQLKYLSSAGISVLLRVKNKLEERNSFIIFYNLKTEIQDLFHFLGFHKSFLVANNTDELSKVLESLEILKKAETDELIVSNRLGMLLEEQVPEPESFHNKTVHEVHPEPEQEVQKTSEEKFSPHTEAKTSSPQFTTTPDFEDVPFVDEIATEPFINVKEEKNFDFTIPFFSKSNEDTHEIPESILETAFPSKDKFHEVKVNCGNCGTQMRILKQGIHRCPSCKSRFAFRQSGSISTIEKLP